MQISGSSASAKAEPRVRPRHWPWPAACCWRCCRGRRRRHSTDCRAAVRAREGIDTRLLPWMDFTSAGLVCTGRHRRRGAVPLDAMADCARLCAPRPRHQLSARTSLRTGRRHNLGSGTLALRDSGHREDRRVSARSPILRACLDGGECDCPPAGLYCEDPAIGSRCVSTSHAYTLTSLRRSQFAICAMPRTSTAGRETPHGSGEIRSSNVDDEQWKKVEAIFLTALDSPDRAAFLDEVCGSDVELRRAIHELLEQDTPTSRVFGSLANQRHRPPRTSSRVLLAPGSSSARTAS